MDQQNDRSGTEPPPAKQIRQGRTRQENTLFIHVPKTGGTSLDSILADHYPAPASLREVQHDSPSESFDELNNDEKLYVSGHLPLAALAGRSFETRITIIRDPLETLCSLISFSKATRYFHHELFDLLKAEKRYLIYAPFFSPAFDFDRYIIERRFGLAGGFQPYQGPWNIAASVEELEQFDYVLDFSNLDSEVKRLIVGERLFPPSRIPARRAHKYDRDHLMALPLLSEEDDEFYRRIKASLFVQRESSYDDYRLGYCDHSGHKLVPNESADIDLSGPIGYGWNDAEWSRGFPFRWSEVPDPSLDIPLSGGGTYSVYLYISNARNTGFSVSGLLEKSKGSVEVTEHKKGDLHVVTLSFSIVESDWLACRFQIDSPEEQIEGDDRAIGVVLANAYLRRIA